MVSILRLQWNYNLNFGTPDTKSIGAVYSPLEPNLAIIASCGPALRPLIAQWFFPGLAETNEGYGSGNIYRQYQKDSDQTNGTQTHGRKQRRSMFQEPRATAMDEQSSPWTASRGHNIALKEMRTKTEVEAGSRTGSEDSIMPQNGIMMTREYVVETEAESVTHSTKKEVCN